MVGQAEGWGEGEHWRALDTVTRRAVCEGSTHPPRPVPLPSNTVTENLPTSVNHGASADLLARLRVWDTRHSSRVSSAGSSGGGVAGGSFYKTVEED